jgi:hypothetical protein
MCSLRRCWSDARLPLLAAALLNAGCGDASEPSGRAPAAAGALAAAGLGGGSAGTQSEPMLGGAAVGAGSGAEGGAELRFAIVYDSVILKRCSACHTDAPSFGGLAYFPGGAAAAYANLVGVPAGAEEGYLCRNSGLLRVQPGEPDRSLFYLKLTNPPCGSHMPPAAFAQPTPEQVELVRRWIAEGAAP